MFKLKGSFEDSFHPTWWTILDPSEAVVEYSNNDDDDDDDDDDYYYYY